MLLEQRETAVAAGFPMTMGFPGDSEREMSVDTNSPVQSAELPKSEQIFKKQRANGHSDINSMTNNVGGAGSKVSGGGSDKAAAGADVSSEDVDVTSMADNEPSANSRLAAATASAAPKKQDPLLKGRLRLIRVHVIGALFKHPKSQPFREPVDAKALGIYPLYNQIVKTPMDLGNVRKKIDRGAYRSRDECVADIEQVWTNAMTFNAPGHFVHEAAKLLRGIAQGRSVRQSRWALPLPTNLARHASTQFIIRRPCLSINNTPKSELRMLIDCSDQTE